MTSTTPKMKKKTAKATSSAVTNGVSSHQSASSSTSPSRDLKASSVEKGLNAFTHLLSGIEPKAELKKFMEQNWEKRPLYIERGNASHYDHLKVSTEAIDEMLRTNYIEFTKNLDVTSYENGIRETHNPDGRALPGSVWGFYRDGCSIRKYFVYDFRLFPWIPLI